jgi:hypothetical protein
MAKWKEPSRRLSRKEASVLVRGEKNVTFYDDIYSRSLNESAHQTKNILHYLCLILIVLVTLRVQKISVMMTLVLAYQHKHKPYKQFLYAKIVIGLFLIWLDYWERRKI